MSYRKMENVFKNQCLWTQNEWEILQNQVVTYFHRNKFLIHRNLVIFLLKNNFSLPQKFKGCLFCILSDPQCVEKTKLFHRCLLMGVDGATMIKTRYIHWYAPLVRCVNDKFPLPLAYTSLIYAVLYRTGYFILDVAAYLILFNRICNFAKSHRNRHRSFNCVVKEKKPK